MTLVLYSTIASPPVRAVLMTAKYLELDLELKETSMAKKDHLTPEFLKINPQHTIPVLDDNGFIVSDSHAICAYLIGKYGKDDSLYPKDLQKRAIVDSKLHFDTGVAFIALKTALRPMVFKGETRISNEHKDIILETYDFLEKFLETSEWVAGSTPTIADICLFATVSSLDVTIPIDTKFSQVKRWMKQTESLPYCEVNKPGLKALEELVKSLLKK